MNEITQMLQSQEPQHIPEPPRQFFPAPTVTINRPQAVWVQETPGKDPHPPVAAIAVPILPHHLRGATTPEFEESKGELEAKLQKLTAPDDREQRRKQEISDVRRQIIEAAQRNEAALIQSEVAELLPEFDRLSELLRGIREEMMSKIRGLFETYTDEAFPAYVQVLKLHAQLGRLGVKRQAPKQLPGRPQDWLKKLSSGALGNNSPLNVVFREVQADLAGRERQLQHAG
ncbi:hypothetical protein IV102_22160 [bacterium]|nr:hypothetical protein [bacterium]